MLVIRRDQMKTFRESAKASFISEMVGHLGNLSPQLLLEIGEEQLRKVICLGIDRASNYAFTHRGPVRLYLELMLLFGSYFDTDPQYSWSQEILTNQQSIDQMQRAEQLYEKVLNYQAHVTDDEVIRTIKVLNHVQYLSQKLPPITLEQFVHAMLNEIRCIYPQRSDYMGEAVLKAVIREGILVAQSHRCGGNHAVVLIVILMLVFGHGCASDPLYPWLSQTLRIESIVDSDERTKLITTKALNWLEHSLKSSDENLLA